MANPRTSVGGDPSLKEIKIMLYGELKGKLETKAVYDRKPLTDPEWDMFGALQVDHDVIAHLKRLEDDAADLQAIGAMTEAAG